VEEKGKKKCFPEIVPRRMEGKTRSDKRWVPPTGDVLKINVDGAFIQASGEAAASVIIRDGNGHHMLSAWKYLKHCRDAEEAEALACLEGIRAAQRWGDRQFVLETDCAAVYGKLQAMDEDRSVIGPIIRDTIQATLLLPRVNYLKIGREQNQVAQFVYGLFGN
jgi:hypothetical protein